MDDMKLDPLQRLAVTRQFLNPKPKNWRLVGGLALIFVVAIALLLAR